MKQIQKSNKTYFNRYVLLFEEIRSIVKHCHKKRVGGVEILSFGCSTGEECKSLDELYVSNCSITGVDIDEDNIKKAKSLMLSKNNNKISFHHASDIPNKKFDIVIAFSVLCKWPDSSGLQSMDGLFTFEEFNKMCKTLSELVNKGGYLAIHNSNYYFEDTDSFKFFKIGSAIDRIGFVNRFDMNSQKYQNKRQGYVFFKKNL